MHDDFYLKKARWAYSKLFDKCWPVSELTKLKLTILNDDVVGASCTGPDAHEADPKCVEQIAAAP